VRDEEFIAGRLDTGFIEGFNRRRADAVAARGEEVDDEEIANREMAVVAAALAYESGAKFASSTQQQQQSGGRGDEQVSRWKLAGRAALHQSRN